MQRFDANNDGAISFDELSDGVRSLGINLTLAEKQSLMKKFDVNYDGEVTAQELLNVISTTNSKLSKTQLGNSVDQVLRKMASGADQFGSMKEYIQTLVTRFDKNYDGHISFDELCAGLNSFQIFLNAQEKRALMNKLDLDKDGEITKVEIYEALRPYEEFKDASRFQ
jgi:Ca2+-binding EF-hand superfamily protein